MIKYVKTSLFLFLPVAVILLSSCTSYKKIPYLQDEDSGAFDMEFLTRSKSIRIAPDDVLSITVNAGREPSVAAAFNLPMQPSATTYDGDESYVNPGVGRQTYLVDSFGEIDFPILGKVMAKGMTREELEIFLKQKLKTYIKEDPVVSVRVMNFNISILGEVNRPGLHTVSRDRINLMEALALAGDMTLYGKRDNVMIVREMPDGNIKKVHLDLSSAEVISSPYFYLEQNDIVYVQPNKARAQSSDIGQQTSIWISLGSMLLTLASLITVVVK